MVTGWCMDDFHDRCPVVVKPFYFEGKKLIYLEVQHCDCSCHEEAHGSPLALPSVPQDGLQLAIEG